MKRIGSLFLAAVLLLQGYPVWAAEGVEPQVAAQGAALVDGTSGRLLWGKNESVQMEMASTTKIMTAILVLERCEPKEIVTISSHGANQPKVHMGLVKGEQWYAEDLLKAMMLKSYNDAAVALAEHISGSVEEFCKEMTEKARKIGAVDTVFGSPNGLDSHLTKEQHHSTAYDMGIITGYALQNPQFREIASLPSYTFSDVSGKKTHTAVNTDRFLQMYSGALGVKTGYTNKAGNCFVGAAERNDITLVSVVLGCGWGKKGREQKWKDTAALMDFGFDTYAKTTLCQKGSKAGSVAVNRSPVDSVDCVLGAGYEGIFSKAERKQVEIIPQLPKSVSAPVEKGTKLGKAKIVLGDTVLVEIPLFAAEDAPTYKLSQWLRILAKDWCRWQKYLAL